MISALSPQGQLQRALNEFVDAGALLLDISRVGTTVALAN